jgi:hypothetical protein
MNTFIKIYVLISLWFWAGMLLSEPLRKAFDDMHWRVLERIYDATWGQVEKAFKTVILYVGNRTQAVRVSIARSLVSKELLEELAHKNLVSAISRARRMDQYSSGIDYDDMVKIVRLGMGKQVSHETKEVAVKKSFEICDTNLFQDIMAKIPRAQEHILIAFDQLEGRAPYDSIKNEEFRKFIRE